MRQIGEGGRISESDDDRVGKGVRFPERDISWISEIAKKDWIGESGRLVHRICCDLVKFLSIFNDL